MTNDLPRVRGTFMVDGIGPITVEAEVVEYDGAWYMSNLMICSKLKPWPQRRALQQEDLDALRNSLYYLYRALTQPV